jgi:hypothetical protein
MKINLLRNFFSYVSIKNFEESFLVLELEMTGEKMFSLQKLLNAKVTKAYF